MSRKGRREQQETEEYEEIEGKFRFLKGTTPDISRKTPGALRATTRDGDRHLVGQAEFIPKEDDATEDWDPSRAQLWEADEDPPDALDSVPWPLAVGVLGLGVVGAIIGARREASQEPDEQRGEAGEVDSSLPPPGWYSVASDVSELRYWDGSSWTDEFARVRDAANAAPADWYPDPTAPTSRLRYWDGVAWTDHVQATNVPADWYPDPSDASSLRWWDGTAWTHHVAPVDGESREPRITRGVFGQDPIYMSRKEWEAHVRAWAAAGALEQSIWWRITHAHITDGDPGILEAQRRMQGLTPAESADRLQSVLRRNPALAQQVAVDELLAFLTQGDRLGAPREPMLNEWR